MKELRVIFFSIIFLISSGCIVEKNVLKSESGKLTTTTVLLQAELTLVPETVNSGEKVSAFLSMKNLREREIENILACIYGYGIEKCEKVNLKKEKDISLSFDAPEFPKDTESRETVYARIYLRDVSHATLQLPIIDENEYFVRKREGISLSSYSLSKENSFVDIDISIDKSPIISRKGKAEFSMTIKIKKLGSGSIFDPDALPSELEEIEEENMNKAYLRINAPSVFDIECDREGNSDGYVVEFFRGEDSVFCTVSFDDRTLSTERIYSIFFEVEYGYYFDVQAYYTVRGMEEFVPAGETGKEEFELEVSFDENCDSNEWKRVESSQNYEVIGVKATNVDKVEIEKISSSGGVSSYSLTPSELSEACKAKEILHPSNESLIEIDDRFCGVSYEISDRKGSLIYDYSEDKWCFFENEDVACENIANKVKDCSIPADVQVIKDFVASPYSPAKCFEDTQRKYSKWYLNYVAEKFSEHENEKCYKLIFTKPGNYIYYYPQDCNEINKFYDKLSGYKYLLVVKVEELTKKVSINVICS